MLILVPLQQTFVVVTNSWLSFHHLIGLYNANNLNAAIAIGTYFKVPDEMIKAALEAYVRIIIDHR
jgi:UDP-N-acetylmuramoyl-tripeptide--D-alanyl-D-alanine ligase